ncbi:hypothetical protein Tco_1081035 [Tanacetum coccineum]|uniref:Uncharacterized protein n=1 Tax=Tanacetum coccineum TaxID=301880 RepID=A0ABQ5HXX9_9ASTR
MRFSAPQKLLIGDKINVHKEGRGVKEDSQEALISNRMACYKEQWETEEGVAENDLHQITFHDVLFGFEVFFRRVRSADDKRLLCDYKRPLMPLANRTYRGQKREPNMLRYGLSLKAKPLLNVLILEQLIRAHDISFYVIGADKLLKNRNGKILMPVRKDRLAQIRA